MSQMSDKAGPQEPQASDAMKTLDGPAARSEKTELIPEKSEGEGNSE